MKARPFVFGAGHAEPIMQALVDAGLVREDDREQIRRVVIDLKIGELARIYTEKVCDMDGLGELLATGVLPVSEGPTT